jgi:hypothetical protein
MANEQVSGSEQKKEDWMNSKWRPMMGWMYMVVCMMDMVIFPILWSLLQTFTHTQITQWNPLTLQGAGLFHIAMGAVLGIAAFGRTQEKLGGANNGGAQLPSSNFTAPSAPSAGFSAATGGFGSAPLGGNTASSFSGSGFGNTAPSMAPAPASSFGGGFGSPSPETTASGKKIVPDFGQPAI